MMKRIYRKLLVISSIFIILISIFFISKKGTHSSDESLLGNSSIINETLLINCERNILSPSEEVECLISGSDFATQISSFHAEIVLGNELTLVTTSKDDVWEGDMENGIIDLYTDNNKSGNFNIGKFKIKAGNITNGVDSNILLTDIEVSDEKFDTYKIEDVLLQLRIGSSINTLSSLTVSNATFNFESNITTYNLNIDLDEITISATPTSNTAKVTGTGIKKLNYGINSFNIVVESEVGTQKTYTINVNRPHQLSFDDGVSVDDEKKYLSFNIDKYEFLKNDILNMINTSGEISITPNKQYSSNNQMGTGSDIKITFGDKSELNYKVIIYGDTTGDGKITVADVSKIYQRLRKNIEMEEVYILAGDVVNDKTITLPDVTKLFQYLKGKNNSLKNTSN